MNGHKLNKWQLFIRFNIGHWIVSLHAPNQKGGRVQTPPPSGIWKVIELAYVDLDLARHVKYENR